MKSTSVWLIALFFMCFSGVAHALSITEAVRLAIEEHPSIKADDSNLRALAAELRESQGSFLPQIDVTGDVGRQRRRAASNTSETGDPGTLSTKEIGVTASLLLFDGFERANTVYRNAARLDGATYRLLSSSETVALNAVEAYIDVVRHRRLVGATRSNIQRHREILALIKERVEGGNSPASDQIQIEERVFAAEAVAIEVAQALQDANSKFERVVGRKPGKKMHVPNVKGLPASIGSLVNQSIANNYAIKQAEKSINELGYLRDATSAGNMPKLFLDGRASAGLNRSGTEGPEDDLYIGLRLSWKVYDGGITRSKEAAASERVTEAQFRRDVAVRDVRDLAKRTWNARTSGLKRRAVIAQQLQTNMRIVANYREEYQLSKRSLLDVLDAERARFNNEFQEVSIAASATFSGYRMLATMSRLAEYFGIAPETIAPQPVVEELFTSDPLSVFDITIEPLQ